MNTDLISVIVPVYNVEKYLHISVDSILSQTYSNLEIILIDDGSTDNSGEICDEYVKKDSRCFAKHFQNRGLSAARNRGIELAHGKYICFIDSDDYVKETYIEYLFNLIKKYNADIAICSIIRVNQKRVEQPPEHHMEKSMSPENAYKLIYNNRKFIGVFSCNKLYKLGLFKDIRFPEGKYFEDSGTTYKLIDKCQSIAYGNDPQYFYRINRPGAITEASKTKDSKRYIDKITFLNDTEIFLSVHYPKALGAFYTTYLGDMMLMAESCKKQGQNEIVKIIDEYLKSHRRYIFTLNDLSLRIRLKALLYFVFLMIS